MTKVEQRKAFMKLRDMSRKPEFEVINGIRFSKHDEYGEIYKVLDETGNIDFDYMDHLEGKDGYELASKPQGLTFKECCTVLTFLLRAERFAQGAFTDALAAGSVYKILSRAIEVM